METKMINIRVNKDLKSECEGIFEQLGINMTTGITMFLKAVVRTKSVPFDLEIPNKETIDAIREYPEMKTNKKKYKRYNSFDKILKEIK